jgi:hypothetical protein
MRAILGLVAEVAVVGNLVLFLHAAPQKHTPLVPVETAVLVQAREVKIVRGTVALLVMLEALVRRVILVLPQQV